MIHIFITFFFATRTAQLKEGKHKSQKWWIKSYRVVYSLFF